MKRVPAAFLLLLVLAVTQACDDTTGPRLDPFDPVDLTVELVTLDVHRPTAMAVPPGGTRLYVAEQFCCVRIVEDGEVLPEPFIDFSDRIFISGEWGMLGIAFHPDFQTNRHVYVSYTNTQAEHRVERYTVSQDGVSVDPASGATILSTQQTVTRHVGGTIAFGPDGMLWVSKGDDAVYSEGDSPGNAQDSTTLHGVLLRLDVDGGVPYAIPPGNPFVGREGRDEIWHYGLRNPWRFSFDQATGLLYIGDVGEGKYEEIDIVPMDEGGHNFGWDRMEGLHCFPDDEAECDQSGLMLPQVEYRVTGIPCSSVIGGHVYRGTEIPELRGHYVYTDLCAGWMRSFRFEEGEVRHEQEWTLPAEVVFPTALAEGPGNELYLLAFTPVEDDESRRGALYRIVRSGDGS